MVNKDASTEWLDNFQATYDLHMPIIRNADEAFSCYRLGREFRTFEPLFIIIDRQGIIRHRSFGRGSITIEAVADKIEELLNE